MATTKGNGKLTIGRTYTVSGSMNSGKGVFRRGAGKGEKRKRRQEGEGHRGKKAAL